jgi:hypothetical protein
VHHAAGRAMACASLGEGGRCAYPGAVARRRRRAAASRDGCSGRAGERWAWEL